MCIDTRRRLLRLAGCVLLTANLVSAHAQSAAAGERKHGICASCHGIGGRSFKTHYPILAGLQGAYILRQLQDFKQGRRTDPNMAAIVPQLSNADMRDLAAYFGSLQPHFSQSKLDPARIRRGRDKARRSHCSSCHRRPDKSTRAAAPRIRGQHAVYLVKQLEDFRSGRRSNDGGVMQRIARLLTPREIEDIADYFASLGKDGPKRSKR